MYTSIQKNKEMKESNFLDYWIQYTVLFLLSCKLYFVLLLFSSLSTSKSCTLITLVFWNSIHLEVATDYERKDQAFMTSRVGLVLRNH